MSTLVYKIGSRLLTDEQGRLNHANMERLVNDLAEVWKTGDQVVVVSSGAVAAGLPLLGLASNPASVVTRQAAASVGQARLMHLYQTLFNVHGIVPAQILLTRGELENRQRFLNARNTLSELLARRILPIINENDSVAIDEIKLGDNDSLASVSSILVGADRCILLTDVDGILKDRTDLKSLLAVMQDADEAEQYLWEKESKISTGGMATKLAAARSNSDFGIATIITNGNTPGVIQKAARGEATGTILSPRQNPLPAWKHWLRHSARSAGKVVVDDGAKAALEHKNSSLLPIGILAVEGDFRGGDVIDLVHDGAVFGLGIVQYGSHELDKIKGCRSEEIERILGYHLRDDVVNRTDLVLTSEGGSQ